MEKSYEEFKTDNLTLDLISPSIMSEKIEEYSKNPHNLSTDVATYDNNFMIIVADAN